MAWIDLAAHPDEDLAACSTDFSEPRARAALLEFREIYHELSQQRDTNREAEVDESFRAQLRALGYACGDPQDRGLSSLLSLPLPGEHLRPEAGS